MRSLSTHELSYHILSVALTREQLDGASAIPLACVEVCSPSPSPE